MTQLTARPHCHQLRKHSLPPIEWLRERYSYDPETGAITGPRGKTVKSKVGNGYLRIAIAYNGRLVKLQQHRLAFALMQNRWPHLVDHINADRGDNRWCNLRESSNSENTTTRGPKIAQYRQGLFSVRLGQAREYRAASALPCALFHWRNEAQNAIRNGEALPPKPSETKRNPSDA